MTFGQLNLYIIKFSNHISSQEVNPDSAIKSERFGCVSLAYSGTDGNDVSQNFYFTTSKHSYSIFQTLIYKYLFFKTLNVMNINN